MKRILASLTLIILGGWWLTAQASVPSASPSTVVLYRASDLFPITFTTAGIGSDAKMSALRQALAAAKPGDTIQLGYGKFSVSDHGLIDKGPIAIPPGVKLVGMGRGQTLLWSNKQIDPDSSGGVAIAMGPAVALSDGSSVEDMDIEDVCYNPGEDCGCIGFSEAAQHVTATITNCSLKSGDWTVYVWSPYNSLTIKDCDITGGRVLLANEDSGDGSNMDVYRCRLFGDAALSKSMGAVSKRKNGGVFGAVCRGGRTRIIDCEMTLKGQDPAIGDQNTSWTPRICGIVDRGGANDGAAGVDVIQVYNLRCDISPNGADPARCFDLDFEFPTTQAQARVNWQNCWGIGADNSLKRSW